MGIPNRLIDEAQGYYCNKCKSLCSFYEQGLVCDCALPWEKEYMIKEYPDYWIKVRIEIISV